MVSVSSLFKLIFITCLTRLLTGIKLLLRSFYLPKSDPVRLNSIFQVLWEFRPFEDRPGIVNIEVIIMFLPLYMHGRSSIAKPAENLEQAWNWEVETGIVRYMCCI